MKKFLFLGALAAMLLGTASCSNEMEPAMTDGTVQFKVELPGAIDSRAIADGTTAIKLDVACYDAAGNILADLQPAVKTDFVNREAIVTYKLVKGQKYNFAFFAHAVNRSEAYPRVNIYSFEPGEKFEDCKFILNGNRTVSDYANNEERDAFYGTLTDYEVTSAETTVRLTRPFAQLNLGTDDLQAAIAAGIEPRNVRIEIPRVSKSFNIATGMASDDDADTGLFYYYEKTGNQGAMPYKKDPTETNLTVDGKDYTWISMNYLLVPANEANVDVKITIHTTKTATGEDGEDFTFNVNNVPVKKNHRTNIVGSLLTQEGNFKVVIDQNFLDPDYTVNYPPADKWDGSVADPVVDGNNVTINSAAQLAGLVANARNYQGKTIKLTTDIDLDNRDWNPIGAQDMGSYPGTALLGVVFDGGNHTIYNLKCNATGRYATAGLIGSVTGTCVIKNLKINGANVSSEHFAGAVVAYMADGTLTIDNCHVIGATITSTPCLYANGNYDDGNQAGGIAGNVGNATITNCSTESSTIKAYRDCGGIIGYLNIANAAQFNGNSVKDCTIIADQSVNNTGYGPKTFNARPLVGRYGSLEVDGTTNTISSVVVKTISTTGEETINNY